MKWKVVTPGNARTFALVFDPGDEVVETLSAFAREQGFHAAHFRAIGAFEEATLAYFDLDAKKYEEIPVAEQVEVAALAGNVVPFDSEPRVHAHAVLTRRDGSAVGGHLVRGVVRPTLELFLVETQGDLERAKDKATGLPLIRIDEDA